MHLHHHQLPPRHPQRGPRHGSASQIAGSSAGTTTARWEFWLCHVQVAASHQLLLAGAVFLNEGSLVGKEKTSICQSTTVKINPSSMASEHPRGSPDRVSQSSCNESPQVQNREVTSRCKTSCWTRISCTNSVLTSSQNTPLSEKQFQQPAGTRNTVKRGSINLCCSCKWWFRTPFNKSKNFILKIYYKCTAHTTSVSGVMCEQV